MEKYIVLEKWEESYENPILIKKNDTVTVDLSIQESDPEWNDWVWCIADNGMDGWVPVQILKMEEPASGLKQRALVIEDYSAYELPVDKDDIVTGSRNLNGWLWCRKENTTKEGWVPIRNIKAIGN